MQGMIEGKWLNRIGEDLAWKPASLGNNLLAQGPGSPERWAASRTAGCKERSAFSTPAARAAKPSPLPSLTCEAITSSDWCERYSGTAAGSS